MAAWPGQAALTEKSWTENNNKFFCQQLTVSYYLCSNCTFTQNNGWNSWHIFLRQYIFELTVVYLHVVQSFFCFLGIFVYSIMKSSNKSPFSFMGLTHQICCFWFCYGIILYIHRQKITLTKDKKGSKKTNHDSNDYFLFWITCWYHALVIQWKEYSLEKHLFFLAPFFIFIVCLFFAGWYKELITSNQIN